MTLTNQFRRVCSCPHNRAEGVLGLSKPVFGVARARVLAINELSAMRGGATEDPGTFRGIALMIATASRPGPALAFEAANQWLDTMIDLHPKGGRRTDKRNAVVPVIVTLVSILKDWLSDPQDIVKFRKA